MNYRWSVTFCVLAFVITALGQEQPKFSNERHRLTPAEELKSRGIELDRVALVEALRNPSPDIRSFAAQELALGNAQDTAPAVAEALASEAVPKARVALSYALAKLGDTKGIDTLEGVCKDRVSSSYLRLEAARLLVLDLREERRSCLNSLLELLRNGSPDSRSGAAWLLSLFRQLSPDDFPRVLQAVVDALADKDTGVRHAASHALTVIGTSSAIPHLERALAIERDEFVRLQMQADLKKLQEKTGHQ